MKHVAAIRQQIESGQTDDALSALDNLLALGPSNTSALKLQASIFHSQGRFVDEHKIWQRVLQIDRQDEDAISYFLRQQQEDREHFYFTDDLPDGGRRFIVYPKSLVNTSAIGLMGCLAFLIVSRLADAIPALHNDTFVLALFFMLVIAPWIGIVSSYLTSLRHIDVTPTHIEVNTRVRKHRYPWHQIASIQISMLNPLDESTLQMALRSKQADDVELCIDLSERGSAIRARSYFVRDVLKHFPDIEFKSSRETKTAAEKKRRLHV
jgi:tetratricopeptide (TPR) repeat protein